ncbi:import inner membrane translocase subunit tim13 [Trichosporon asahii var. asahii CBS 8904]|uniref:Mitochondrial import inner membrane translocase subunit n=2 Tax=Trichosporon asahii var. asahii TaxID=189963 RepID=K1VX03_TRIAC|nr:import inner membrane translocase subunit tim13 [Trichosporon asahii var. asahii CBS 2479]EJT52520.1 import inner membrane translocase subunit tim13 [Trichosporon asahii var. asahii CBS 2479]EKD05041.1 import inner membrane translocase subunit tim13 [Trichosporon asahii var. asahii CBS 8904]
MSSLFGSSGAATTSQQQKEQLKQQIQQELAVAGAQQLINKITENCFAKCITRPGTSLGASDERCLTQCMTLYMAAFDQVSRSYVARVSKERNAAQQ